MPTYTHKMVNGNKVPLTAQEVAEFEARDRVIKPALDAARARREGLVAATQEFSDRLARSTAQQIDDWFAANSPAQTIDALKTLAKIVALKL